MINPKCVVVQNQNHIVHRSETTSPENPGRVTRIMSFLEGRLKLFKSGEYQLLTDFPDATDDQILKVHDEEYFNFVKRFCENGGGFLGDSTYFSHYSFRAAKSAVGGAIKATEMVANNEVPTSFALIRPPGHHASKDKFGGYCIFNNVAVAIRHLQDSGLAKKIMIVDLDAHAGNGTMRIFYEDPDVLTLSVHRDPQDFYPHDGFSHQIGRGDGRGYNINVEMPEGSGDDDYLLIFDNIIKPVYDSYSPDFLITLVGFDAHFSDLQSNMQLTSHGYYGMIKLLKKMNNHKLPVILEGGYTAENATLAHTILCALADESPPYEDDVDTLSSSITRSKKTRTILHNNIEELRSLLEDYHDLK